MTLAADAVRDFYDRFGARQDAQEFYERAAIDDLVAHASLHEARAVYEFGCGTGRLAAELLANVLPADARYFASDVSTTMLSLTRQRLAPFGARAETVRQEPGSVAVPLPDGSVDRVLTTYVLDLLPGEAIAAFVTEAARILAAGGRLCIASLGWGSPGASWLVARAWYGAFRLRPALVGGCRPIRLQDYVGPPDWQVLHHRRLSAWGVPSEALVARPVSLR